MNKPFHKYPFEVGERVQVFNSNEWKGKDVGNNSQFWQLATILEIYSEYRHSQIEWFCNVEWVATGKISSGHFLNSIKKEFSLTD